MQPNASFLTLPGGQPVASPAPESIARLMHLRPYVRQTGDDWRKPWFLKLRKLFDYLVVYIAEGSRRFTVRDSPFHVTKGDLIWVPPDTPHEMEGYAPIMRCLFTHFDLLYDPRRSHWNAYIPGGTMDLGPWSRLMHPPVSDPVIASWCGKLPIANPARMQNLLEQLCIAQLRGGSGSQLALSGLLLQLLDAIIEGAVRFSGSDLPHCSGLQQAALSVQEDFSNPVDIRHLARQAGLSSSHFRKLFRETFGKGARKIHQEARMRKACAMLIYQSMSVSEVAEALGFSNVHNFSRAFKRIQGSHRPNIERVSGFEFRGGNHLMR